MMPPPQPLQWSQELEKLHYQHVLSPVLKDPRTDWDENKNISLGYPFKVIRDEVIRNGRADFCRGHSHEEYGDLTAEHKVLLYCFVNFQRHFFEAVTTFRAYRPNLKSLIDSTVPTRMVDLGCGPGTAGLALGECLNQPNIRYFGLDVSKAMQSKARSMLQAALDCAMLGDKTQLEFTSSWAALEKSATTISRPTNVFFNATYLFASDSLRVEDVCQVIMAYKDSPKVKRLLFVYTNSSAEIAGKKFRELKRKMKSQFTCDHDEATCSITYSKRRKGGSTVEATHVRQLLDFTR